MDFLKEEFLDQLRAEVDEKTGKVIIEAVEFTPQQILQEISEVTFDTVFEEWKENRKETNLKQAKTILEENNNERRFGALKKCFKKGAVIPFVGAGMSTSSGYPSWAEFLSKMLNESSGDADQFSNLMNEGKFEAAAQLVHDAMGEARFNEELENEFGSGHPSSGPVQLLPRLFDRCVITTNFDGVLKACFEKAGKPFANELYGVKCTELKKHLGEEENILVKLHGKATSAQDRVITLDQYKKYYDDDQVLERCIKAITCKTLLFLGCSLKSDRTIIKMREIIVAEGHECMPRHYAFLQLDDSIDRISRLEELAEANIYPIWYQDDHDESIEALLEKLAEGGDV